ncbi:hypothetical protein GOBAR_DD09840 [Gossypium barbadense]|nr:hypothetical protein GOBAR_DD09840 [Gossypium barbadense]
MSRRKVRELSILQGTPNSAETNSTEQQTAIGSSNVPITPEEPTEVETENGGTRRVRGRMLLRDLYELDPVERVKVSSNSFDYRLYNIGKRSSFHKDKSMNTKNFWRDQPSDIRAPIEKGHDFH